MINNEDLDLLFYVHQAGYMRSKQNYVPKKINIITEKPMATNWNDALSMVKACDDENVRLFVVKQTGLIQPCNFLKRALTENRIW